MNLVALSGFLPFDPVLKHTKDQKPFCLFNLTAIGFYKYRNKEGKDSSYKQYNTVPCICWGNRGVAIANYLKKGSTLSIEGIIKNNKINGRHIIQIEVRTAEFGQDIKSDDELREILPDDYIISFYDPDIENNLNQGNGDVIENAD